MNLHPSDCTVALVANHWQPSHLHAVYLIDGGASTWSPRGAPRDAAGDPWGAAAYLARVLARWHRMSSARARRDWLAGWGHGAEFSTN